MNLENILLLSCRSEYLDSDKVYPPLANLYLHSAIKREHPEVRVTITDDYENIDFTPYDMVGISIMTPQREEAERLKAKIKSQDPNKLVVAGGPHVKYYGQEMKGWDIVIPYDGVRVINQIIEGRRDPIMADKIDSTTYRDWETDRKSVV